jgi:hypothetical protein
MRNQRRIGEALMIASGIGVAAAGVPLGVMPLLKSGIVIGIIVSYPPPCPLVGRVQRLLQWMESRLF